jgi:hypothetical protein
VNSSGSLYPTFQFNYPSRDGDKTTTPLGGELVINLTQDGPGARQEVPPMLLARADEVRARMEAQLKRSGPNIAKWGIHVLSHS